MIVLFRRTMEASISIGRSSDSMTAIASLSMAQDVELSGSRDRVHDSPRGENGC